VSDANVTNIIVAGLGGQGVLTCSDILAEAAFRTGCDVKKAEVHGMSQRGGSVACDVRMGSDVRSPMVPTGQADYLLVLAEDQVDVNRGQLAEGGTLITPDVVDAEKLSNKKSLNVAMLGVLSKSLEIDREHWVAAIRTILPEKIHDANIEAFDLGAAN
jgi:indolepyruvate ferredoxin oxidoreductase beta subunit